jgi:hypothetical protein
MKIERFSAEDKWSDTEWDLLEESRQHIPRRLSGAYKIVPCYCDMCKQNHSKSIPIEHANCINAFKLNGRFVINCDYCNNKNYKRW